MKLNEEVNAILKEKASEDKLDQKSIRSTSVNFLQDNKDNSSLNNEVVEAHNQENCSSQR